MESAILHILVVHDAFVVVAPGQDAEELLKVDVVHGARANLAPCTQIDVESWCSRTATERRNAFQVTGITFSQVENLSGTLVHHLYLDDALSSLTAFVAHTFAFGIEFGRWEFYLVEDVLLHVVLHAFVLVVTLIGHIYMEQCLAGRLQFAVLLGADAQLLQWNFEIQQVAGQILWLEKECTFAHAQLLTNAVLQLCNDGYHQVRLHKREVTTYLRITDGIENKIQIPVAREGLYHLVLRTDD